MELPVEKQFKILDLLRQGNSVRKTQKQAHVPKSTVQDYKKRGIPYYRKHSPNIPVDLYPASWPEERKWFIQKMEESKQRENKLTQDNNQKDKKIENSTQKIEEQGREIKKKDQQLTDIDHEWQRRIQKINTIFSEIMADRETWITKYNTAQEELKTLRKKIEQSPEPHQEIQTTKETTPVNGDKDDSSIKIPWEAFLCASIIAGGTLAIILAYRMNKPAIPILPTRTPQPNFPLKWCYDQKRAIWILHATNGDRIIPDNVITTIQEMNQKITDGTFLQPTSDEPVNPNLQPTRYITVAYRKDALFAVPVSQEGVVQLGPIRVLPCE
jgi:hypothetical protein